MNVRLLFAASLFGAVGCAPSMAPPVIADPTPLAKCQVTKSAESPLVTEWPASEKAHLESLLASQAVVVAYGGCELRLLESCRPEGAYAFQRTSLASDTIEITDVGKLYARLPLGAAGLEAELQARGRLAIHMTAVGQQRLRDDVRVPRGTACEGATHIVRAVSVGAYDMVSGGAIRAGAGASTGPVGVGASRHTEQVQLRSGGDRHRCATTGDHPHADCRSPLQLFLTPVAWASPTAQPGPAEDAPPPQPTASSPPEPPSQASRAQPVAPPEPATTERPNVCAPLELEIVRVTRVRPRTLHLPKGGSRLVLRVTNPTPHALTLPSSSALTLVDDEGRSATPVSMPDAESWYLSAPLPANATTDLTVILRPGLTSQTIASLTITGITPADDPFTACTATWPRSPTSAE